VGDTMWALFGWGLIAVFVATVLAAAVRALV
jgi:hypothetical protein